MGSTFFGPVDMSLLGSPSLISYFILFKGVVVHELVEEEWIHQYINQTIFTLFLAAIEGRERKRNEKREKKGREIYMLMERGAERVQFLLEELKS